ncbi:MAG: hypothetical protein KatS3mg012_0895 [Gaiellaceae bacterium]|nr:MAG: hypothetical protein KatS3mg012_0895 [Gaiellaceae bacterium]
MSVRLTPALAALVSIALLGEARPVSAEWLRCANERLEGATFVRVRR